MVEACALSIALSDISSVEACAWSALISCAASESGEPSAPDWSFSPSWFSSVLVVVGVGVAVVAEIERRQQIMHRVAELRLVLGERG